MYKAPYPILIGEDYPIDYLVLSKLPLDKIILLFNYGNTLPQFIPRSRVYCSKLSFSRNYSHSWFQLIKFLTSDEVKDINIGLDLSALSGNITLVEYFIRRGGKVQEAMTGAG